MEEEKRESPTPRAAKWLAIFGVVAIVGMIALVFGTALYLSAKPERTANPPQTVEPPQPVQPAAEPAPLRPRQGSGVARPLELSWRAARVAPRRKLRPPRRGPRARP